MKSQISLEFLIILLLVLVISAIASFYLFDLRVINDNLIDRESGLYWKNSDLAIFSTNFNGTNGTISFQNNFEFPLVLTNFSLDGVFVFNGSKYLESGEVESISFPYVLNSSEVMVSLHYQELLNSERVVIRGILPLSVY